MPGWGEVRLLERVKRRLADLDQFVHDPLEPIGGDLLYMRSAGGSAFVIARLLRLTPFYTLAARDGLPWNGSASDAVIRISLETGRPLFRGGLNFEGEADNRDMPAFAGFVRANKVVLETQLGTPIRADVEQKPMQQLGTVLKMLGLPFMKPKKRKASGEMTRRYQINRDDHEAMTGDDGGARERIGGWRFMTECYGIRDEPLRRRRPRRDRGMRCKPGASAAPSGPGRDQSRPRIFRGQRYPYFYHQWVVAPRVASGRSRPTVAAPGSSRRRPYSPSPRPRSSNTATAE